MDESMKANSPKEITILVVDDEAAIQKVLRRTLEDIGYIIVVADDGQKALKCLETTFFDVVITDIFMPNLDGLELTKKIKAQFSTDVIVITGHSDRYHYEELIALGASDFIQKPIVLDEIVLRVKRVLRERQLKAELIQYHKEFAQAQKLEAIGLLAAGIAHEINTPIQYIGDNTIFIKESFEDLSLVVDQFKHCLGAARKGTIDEQFIKKMEIVLEQADVDYLFKEIPIAVEQTLEGVDRVRKIVRSMKEFSHPGAKEKAMVDIHHTIENTVTLAINEWKYCADLSLDFAKDIPMVNCDASEMSQVFLNLIINASHAIMEKIGPDASEKGKITISTRKNDQWVNIKISDTGTGIPKKIIEKVFDPFFTTKEVGKGTGQGLAISRSVVVERHKGKLEIETQKGKGTSFIIKLPLLKQT